MNSYFEIKVYTIYNQEFSYLIKKGHSENTDDPESMERLTNLRRQIAREHAKRIINEGYWYIEDDGTEVMTEVMLSPWQIVKVKIITHEHE